MLKGLAPIGGGSITGAQVALNISQATYLQKFRKALAGTRAGLADTKILMMGDSNAFGFGSNATTNLNRMNGMINRLGDMYNRAGFNVTHGFYGDGGTNSGAEESAQYDSRVSVGSGWSQGTKFIGGAAFQATAVTSNLGFTPGGSFDRVVVTYFQFSGGGTFDWKINAGAATNQSTNGANQLQTLTITITAGQTVNLNWVSGTVWILGFYPYINANKQIICLNAGWNGAKTTDLSGVLSVSTVNTNRVGQNLTICILSKNDANSAVSVATAKTNYQSCITDWLTQGDVALCTYPPDNTADSATQAIQDQYQGMIRDLANTNGCALIEIYNRFVSYTNANTLGFMNDSKHPNGYGYADMASLGYNTLGNP